MDVLRSQKIHVIYLTGASSNGESIRTTTEFVSVTGTTLLIGSFCGCEVIGATTVFSGETAATVVIRTSGGSDLIGATTEFSSFAGASKSVLLLLTK